jgi:hypothetical protein
MLCPCKFNRLGSPPPFLALGHLAIAVNHLVEFPLSDVDLIALLLHSCVNDLLTIRERYVDDR